MNMAERASQRPTAPPAELSATFPTFFTRQESNFVTKKKFERFLPLTSLFSAV
jgi:hypothetical protein